MARFALIHPTIGKSMEKDIKVLNARSPSLSMLPDQNQSNKHFYAHKNVKNHTFMRVKVLNQL